MRRLLISMAGFALVWAAPGSAGPDRLRTALAAAGIDARVETAPEDPVSDELLVRVRDRYAERVRRGTGLVRRWTRWAPYATASLVFIVGLGLAIRSLALV